MIEIKHKETGRVLRVVQGANLEGTNLRGADLEGANLRGTDLYGANLRSTDLYGANLYGAEGIYSFQCGDYNRVSYCIYNEQGHHFKIGCHYDTLEPTLKAIRSKYGDDSDYEKLVLIYNNMLNKLN